MLIEHNPVIHISKQLTMTLNSKIIIPLALVTLLLSLPRGAHAVHKMSLDVDIDVDNSQISGISKIGVTAGDDIVLRTGALIIEDVRLNNRPADYDEIEGTVKLRPDSSGELEIRYRGVFKGHSSPHSADNPVVHNVIDERGVSLTNIWYPVHDTLSTYELKATFPAGYTAISEAEDIKKTNKGGKVEYRFRFPYQVDGVNLVASDKYRVVKDEFRDIEIYAYFYPEDTGLAKTYIEYTKKYLEMYEDLVGMYPYRRFSIVENFLPTGYSMPTYTLLGSTVVTLPFIVKTSLGHEILHQWFGNYVYIDYDAGNWAEGLTTYLADHLYREREGEGWKYRKQMMIDYRYYVHEDRDFPLTLFSGRVDRLSRAVGYGKTAMVFHMLKNITGKDVFFASLKDLIETRQFKRASWDDIRNSFERHSGRDLEWFFDQWINRKGLPELELYGVEVKQTGSDFNLHFHIDQAGPVYKLQLPLTIYMQERLMFDSLYIDSRSGGFDLILPDRPVKIVIDEDYDLARVMTENELPPVIAGLLGDEKILISLPDAEADMYRDIIDNFEREGAVLKPAGEISISDIESSSVMIPGIGNPLIKRLCGEVKAEEAGFYIIMKKNPWNPEKVLAIIQGRSNDEVAAAFRKIPHYGKYSKLLFNKGRNTAKETEVTERGMVMALSEEASAIEISSVKTLSDVIKGVLNKKIIYVGEVHDVFAHHAVQLDVITGIYKNNPRTAIGMEMFQRPFQETLDDFIQGRIGEFSFLKKSEYFKRWGFDYHLYKPILDFARTEKIPVIALNLEREIIKKVSADGIDSLTEEEKKAIPAELDFSDDEYRERLKEVFSMHKNSEEKKFDYFYQSQVLWDETMSQSVDAFIEENSVYQIVVLAGQGHLRFGSGIPKRTYRRNKHDYAIVLIDSEVEKGIADYVIFPKPVEGVTAPKLMAFLSEEDGKVKVAGFPDDSISEKAGIETGDIIISLDDDVIGNIEDIKIHLQFRNKGDSVNVKVKRKVDGKDEEMNFELKL